MLHLATRPPMERMMLIDQALRANRLPNSRTLGSELGVNPKTVQRDVVFMRDRLGAPIEFDPIRNGYRYTSPTYRMPNVRLTDGNLMALFVAGEMMRRFRGTPFEKDMRRALNALGNSLPDGISVRLDTIADFLSVLPATECEYNEESFHTLTQAVVCRRRLDLKYWSASRNETTKRVFDPYELSLVDDGWYAIGHCHLRAAVRMFAIQRVLSVRETGETFDRPAGFRVEEYLRGSFRAVRGDGDHEVVLRFHPDIARRVAEKKWHPSQVLKKQPDGGLVVRMRLSSLVEVRQVGDVVGREVRGAWTDRVARPRRN